MLSWFPPSPMGSMPERMSNRLSEGGGGGVSFGVPVPGVRLRRLAVVPARAEEHRKGAQDAQAEDMASSVERATERTFASALGS